MKFADIKVNQSSAPSEDRAPLAWPTPDYNFPVKFSASETDALSFDTDPSVNNTK